MPNYSYYPDPKDNGKTHWRYDDSNSSWEWTNQPWSNAETSAKITDWTKVDKPSSDVTSLYKPTTTPTSLFEPLPQHKLPFDTNPPHIYPDNKNGFANPLQLPSSDAATTAANKSLADTIFDSENKNLKEQTNYNSGKLVGNSLLTGAAMLSEMTAKRPDKVKAPVTIAPTYQSVVPEMKNELDKSAASQMANATRQAQETGRPDLIQAFQANNLSALNSGYSQISEKDIQQKNMQAGANAEAINKTSEQAYGAKIQDNEMMDQINLRRSELINKMGSQLFNTIPDTYMKNKSSLIDMGNKELLFKDKLMIFELFKLIP